MRRLRRPESYIAAKDAATVLREIATETEQRDDGQLVSVRIERKYASVEEIKYSLKPPPKRALKQKTLRVEGER